MTAVSTSLQQKLENLPKRSGCYLFKEKQGQVIYVGKAKNLRNRVRSYFQESRTEGIKFFRLRSRIIDLETIVTDSEVEALILEMNLVKEYKPRYNINLKDDKSFPYIRVTNERFPRIFPTRKIIKDGSRYFGPYTDVGSMKSLLKAVKRIFPVRSCNYNLTEEVVARKKYKICLDYHIKKCDGPCEGLVSEQEYGKMVEQIVRFINGKNRQVLVELQEKMALFADSKRYEDAARVRDQIASIEQFQFKQKVVTDEELDRDIIAVAEEGDDACGVVFKIRDGKILGRQHFYLSGVEEEQFPQVVSSFLKQYYLKSDFIPAEIYIPAKINDQQQVEQWLSGLREKGLPLLSLSVGKRLN